MKFRDRFPGGSNRSNQAAAEEESANNKGGNTNHSRAAMLKKWLRKRRKGGGKEKNLAQASTAPDNSTSSDGGGRGGRSKGRRVSFSSKKKGPKSPGRKSQYTNIEEDDRPPFPHPSRVEDTQPKKTDPYNFTRSIPDSSILTVSRPHNFAIKSDKKERDVKKEVPLVRIRPIEGPRQRSSSSHHSAASSHSIASHVVELPRRSTSSVADDEEVIETPLTFDKASTPPSTLTTTVHTTTNHFHHDNLPSSKEAPPPPPSTSASSRSPPPPPLHSDSLGLSRDLSYLGVASPPSIDTALFAYEEDEKDKNKERHSGSGGGISLTPPFLIEAVMPRRVQQPSPPADSDSEDASAKSISDFRRELSVDRPFRDETFFTATTSMSGTGSAKLQLWLDEVKRSIHDRKKQTQTKTVYDRYHIGEDKSTITEDTNETKEEVLARTQEQALAKSKKMIERALKESIMKSKAEMMAANNTAPKGILKSKVVEADTINDDVVIVNYGDDTTAEHSSEGEDPISERKRASPIKIFSSSRRQTIEEDTDDESSTASSSASSSGSDAYETLRHQIKPSFSMDDTIKSNSSNQFFYSKLCDVGVIMGYEEELCQLADDDTVISDDTGSKDSFVSSRSRWMACFDAF